MLVSLKPILEDAMKNKYAVGSFNMLSLEYVLGAIKAAEELSSPLIIQLAEVHTPWAPMEYMAPIMIEAARKAKVPVAVHFDHGTSYESVAKAIKLGFSSVMFDGASNNFDVNVALTKEVSKLAHSMGVTLEAELGQVGDAEGSTEGNGTHMPIYTDVKEASKFVEQTKVDALAVAIGNLHGEYKATPVLNYDLVKTISETTLVPLVLHGGSGTGEQGFKKCINNGICKINVATAIQLRSMEKVRESFNSPRFNYFNLKEQLLLGCYEAVREHIKIFGSSFKA
jgi:fructose-bisphosphate aldolase, class II